MSGITEQSGASTHGTEPIDKGKGKAIVPAEETENETSDEEMNEAGDEEEDELAGIDPSNIIPSGRRTRGKQIDFAKAAAEQPSTEEDSEDDEDFVAVEDAEKTDQEMH